MLEIMQGDWVERLRELPAASVQCCVTSPPYWGLRDYGVEGQLGLEKTPEEYVAKMVAGFREVRRVLKDDGTLWLNLGDSYATGAGAVGNCHGGGEQGERWKRGVAYNGRGELQGSRGGSKKQPHTQAAIGPTIQPNRMPIPGLKPKDLVGIPWMVAFALRAAGWYLRSDIIWHKPNPMPESVTDRPTKSHEYLFLLTKSQRYYYDAAAIAEQLSYASVERLSQNVAAQNGSTRVPGKSNGAMRAVFRKSGDYGHGAGRNDGDNHPSGGFVSESDTRNKRTVWTVTTQPYSEAHFATFPPDLIKPCILAGSRNGDTILDPFGGSGTTGMVAIELGRKAILCELNPTYVSLIRQRCDVTPGLAL